MTTVVCTRDTMACDLQATVEGTLKMKIAPKWQHFKYCPVYPDLGEFVMGFAGTILDWQRYLEFLIAPDDFKGKVKKMPQILILTKNKQILMGSGPTSLFAIEDKFAAIGSGSPAALGAMNAGASPKEAVLAASKVDPMTGMGVKTFMFK